VRFVDFLKAAVLISAGAATALAAAAIAGAASAQDNSLALGCVGWWLVAAAIGTWLGRRVQTSPGIARLLASARYTTALPEQQPGRILLNRLWPLLLCTVGAGALAFLAPQIPGIAAGFAIIWALAWRRQEQAVTAIEERDGARFYIEQTSPVRAMKLIRTPGFRARFAPLDPSYEKAETTP
jgi:hypothetical protein